MIKIRQLQKAGLLHRIQEKMIKTNVYTIKTIVLLKIY